MKEQKKILSCWHKLEHFSPSPVPSGENVKLLNETEPWKIPFHSNHPNKTIEYTVYLGVFDLSVVNEFIKEYFNNTVRDENFRDLKVCFASLKLDAFGVYKNESFGISTLPWALSQLENNKINNNFWEEDFKKIKEELEKDLDSKEIITDSDNQLIETSIILNRNHLLSFQKKIESLCGWSIKPNKEIHIKKIERFIAKENNDTKATADILNSFYIKDLEKIISKYDEKSNPKAFQQYLDGSLGRESNRIDISRKINELKTNLTANNYPDGCWPSDYTLSLMQQYAVNNIFNNLSEDSQEGMFSVNGPPGTGKTTLLRDIIASIIVKRAKKLSKIKNPPDAFKNEGKLEIRNSDFSPYIYSPQESLTNTGIVIASSNNGAVENISKELPLKEEVSKQYKGEVEYFKKVAENCVNKGNWGIISAVLGNKQNRNNLVSDLWFNKDYKDLQKTLKEDKLYDNSEWNKIKTLFNSKLNEIKEEKEKLSVFENEYEDYIDVKNTLLKIKLEFENLKQDQINARRKHQKQKNKISILNEDKKEIINELSIIKDGKPNFFAYWFNKKKRIAFNQAYESALNIYNEISEKLVVEKPIFLNLDIYSKRLESLLESKKKEEVRLKTKFDILRIKIGYAKLELKHNYADSKFWKNIESKSSQESCPWYSEKLKRLQSELFIISLKLNEVFILTANSKSSRISTTLAGFFEYLKGGSKATKKEVKAMWDTFFLVIPVVSSTFASIQTMFKDLDKEDIPWLFIDEAGQAIPQAAVGSIWRSKRVGVVGDPFQIEPVVTIPNSITDNISKYFDFSNKQIGSELSVQSMADRINPLGSYLTINDKKEWIGMPLRVHRRCINPMFEISNSIAYENTMYCSTVNPKKINIKFQTSFIHCKGKVVGKHFVQEQAEIIKDILLDEIIFCKNLPDVFVISPFNEISSKLNSFLFKHLFSEVKKYKEVNTVEMGDWLKKHIGTVHTFQGKQAAGVVLCLGLDERTKGAANWASQKPNLLNVAITRAKFRFIAIGDKDIWLKQEYFNQLIKLNKQEELI